MTLPGADQLTATGARPLVLLPVRIETRYADGQTLRVRVYPDDIHVDRLDRGISEAERAAAVAYWLAVVGGAAADSEYAELTRTVGADRAPWVATAMTPLNLFVPADPVVPDGGPLFPLTTPRTDPPPVARALPDRFVGAAYAEGAVIGVGIGAAVARPLVMGPARGGRMTTMADGLAIGADTEWLVDYDAAKTVGLGFDITLQSSTEVTLLLVFGVRAGDGTGELEDLLHAHRVTDGVEFLAVGTPTNNTESARSSWSRRSQPGPPPTRVHQLPPDSDAARLSAALGITAATLAPANGADAVTAPIAEAARATLWPASWGNFFAAVGPHVSDRTRETMRDLFERSVHGQGPLATLRIGVQPYGMLPVVPRGESLIVEPSLESILLRARSLLRSDDPPSVADPAKLSDVLGGAPAMLGLRLRAALPDLDELFSALVIVVDPFGGGAPPPYESKETGIRRAIATEFGLDFGRLELLGFGSATRPLLLPLVAAGDAGYASALVAGTPRQIGSVLQATLEAARQTEVRSLEIATGGAPPPRVEGVADFALAADIERVVSGADRSPALLRSVADRLADQFGYAGPALLDSYQPLGAMPSSLSLLDIAAQIGRPEPLRAALQTWCRAQYRIARFDEAMQRLTAAPAEQRALAVATALDCCSHRLDAWFTALATDRLDEVRAAAPTGVTLGAYGWVENIRRNNEHTAPPGGYIHAPSIGQAVTAGILRSANLAHHGSTAFGVDLPSTRMRAGLQVLDGIRQGQPLGALLGYHIERGLHEHGLDQFILTLRTLAPLAAGELTSTSAIEGVTRSGVLDGVRLLALPRAQVLDALAHPPADNPFLPGPVTVTAGARTLVGAILDDAASLQDAAADLLLAEGVHQLASGATARAGAALNALGRGGLPPPQPEFARTPSSGVAITHRDIVLLSGHDVGGSGWATGSPRAQAEPWLERWVETLLGPADRLALGDGVTLAAADVSALDVVYAAAEPNGLWQLVSTMMPTLAGTALPSAARSWAAVAQQLFQVISTARPLTPADLLASGSDATRTIDEDAQQQRAQAVIDKLVGVAGSTDPREFARFGIYAADIATAQQLAQRRVTAARAALPDVSAASEAVFGEQFPLLPRFATSAADLGLLSVAPHQVRRFLLDVATVRPAVSAHLDALLFAHAPSNRLRVAQFDRSGPARSWVVRPFGADSPAPDAPVTSLVLDCADVPGATDAVAGLVVDEWVEVVPRAKALTTGLAVHADAPDAQPPQAVLIAASPDGADWSADQLATTLLETLDLAKLRATTLEHTSWLGWVLPALLFPAFSMRGEPILDFKQLSDPAVPAPVPYVREPDDAP